MRRRVTRRSCLSCAARAATRASRTRATALEQESGWREEVGAVRAPRLALPAAANEEHDCCEGSAMRAACLNTRDAGVGGANKTRACCFLLTPRAARLFKQPRALPNDTAHNTQAPISQLAACGARSWEMAADLARAIERVRVFFFARRARRVCVDGCVIARVVAAQLVLTRTHTCAPLQQPQVEAIRAAADGVLDELGDGPALQRSCQVCGCVGVAVLCRLVG